MKTIAVIGSTNMDLVATAARIPVTGETLTGRDFFMVPGGKGANQAVAAAKLGAKVLFVARLGKDNFAAASLDNFRKVGIDTRYVKQLDSVPSGVALIAIDDNGKNIIIVIPGANAMLSAADVADAEAEIAKAAVVVCQLEVPLATVVQAAKTAKKHNVPFILDPAPVVPLDDELLSMIDIIKPNEVEAKMLTGIEVSDFQSASKAADVFFDKGVGNVIITLGAKGFLLATKESREIISNHKVKALDSTAAGDTFTGAMASRLAAGESLRGAALYANAAAALSVTKLGAQSSMPDAMEVAEFMKKTAI